MGYHQAGFDVVGVDLKPQPRYPFEFHRGDVTGLAFYLEKGQWCIHLSGVGDLGSFDAIHASPPCQAHSDLKHMHNAKKHEDLVPLTRGKLQWSGLPYIIENVEGSPLINPTVLCGTMFRLGSGDAELWRHRLFETSFAPLLPPPCHHRERPRVIGVYGGHGRDRRRTVNTQDYSTEQRREAMGIDWMTGAELSQAIPPAYTRFIGEHLLSLLEQRDAA